jgi:hypothetical protein
MLLFLMVSECYHFYVIIFPSTCLGVIIYVIILCYHLLLSFSPFFLFPENVTHLFLNEKNDRKDGFQPVWKINYESA